MIRAETFHSDFSDEAFDANDPALVGVRNSTMKAC